MSRIALGEAPIMLWGIPLNRVSFVDTDKLASPKHNNERPFPTQSFQPLIGRKNQANFENECFNKLPLNQN